ncbi:MAG TPA: ABC transporter permease [Gemmatimonadaceae bacterium]
MVIALRAGVINLGGDGQLLAGAVAATSIARWLDKPGGVLAMGACLTAAAVAGAAWTLLPAWLKARSGTMEVVSTIMMNFVAAYVVSYLVRGPLQEPTHVYPQSASIAAENQLPLLLEGSRLYAGIVLALIAALAAWILLERTASGFRIRAVGSNPRAAELAGRIDVRRVQRSAFLASGALPGLAGGVEVLGGTFALYENLSPGYGYSAIAVALLARLGPLRAVGSAILLGGLAAGATAMQRDAGPPAGAAATVEATLILAILGGEALLLRWTAARMSIRPLA